jgi:hypothetical protein
MFTKQAMELFNSNSDGVPYGLFNKDILTYQGKEITQPFAEMVQWSSY